MSNTAGGWFTNSNLDHYNPVTIPHLVVTRCSYKPCEQQHFQEQENTKNTLKIIFFFVKFCIHDLAKIL